MYQISAAHKSLPLGTVVRVENLDNGRRLDVRINDRGPFVGKRIIDLSYAAARELDMVAAGVVKVKITVIGFAKPTPGGFAKPTSGGSAEPSPAATAYTVQVGAFQDPGRAARLSRLLRRGHHEVRVSSDGEWHRVQVGRFSSREKADKLRRELPNAGYDAVVVVDRAAARVPIT
jgi:rare lipoprotein A